MVIAIDGPAASGKSSTAQWVAERLGYLHVDSGSLYRALTAAALRGGTPVAEWTPDLMLAQGDRVSLRPGTSAFVALIDGEPAEEEIRGSGVTAHVSHAATMPEVRAWVNDRVRRAAETQDVVVDGRDMGTAVFPDAPLKIFLIADSWERARRRLTQRLNRRPTEKKSRRRWTRSSTATPGTQRKRCRPRTPSCWTPRTSPSRSRWSGSWRWHTP